MLERLLNLYDMNPSPNRFLGFDIRDIIDTGGNSIVLNAGRNVIKPNVNGRFSNNSLSLSQISFYQEITNACTNLDLHIKRQKVIIVPIDEIGFFEPLKCPYSVSELIPGPNLDDAKISNFGLERNDLLKVFRELDKIINKYLNTEGVYIAPTNVKFQPGNGFFITDLGAEIRNIKYNST